MDRNSDGGIPSELKERLDNLDEAVSKVESMLQPLLSTSHADLVEKLGPLDAARLDLIGVYSINSLFWMYLNVCGVNPKDHPVKKELERIQSYMARIKEAQDSLNKPRLDKPAARRFVKSALWQKSQKKGEEADTSKEQSTSTAHQSTGPETTSTVHPSGRKRKHNNNAS